MAPAAANLPRIAIIWMHGLGDTEAGWQFLNGTDFSHMFPNVEWVFPRAPLVQTSEMGGGRVGAASLEQLKQSLGEATNSWFDVTSIPITPTTGENSKTITASVKRVHELIDELQREEVLDPQDNRGEEDLSSEKIAAAVSTKFEGARDPHVGGAIPAHRIFLGGFSQGGALAILSMLRYPKRLAGAINFSGWLLRQKQLEKDAEVLADTKPKEEAAAQVDAAPALKIVSRANLDTPVLWWHGSKDPMVLFEMQARGAAALRKLGLKVTERVAKGAEHTTTMKQLKHFPEWLEKARNRTEAVLAEEEKKFGEAKEFL